jgi:3-dehydroquinate synthase
VALGGGVVGDLAGFVAATYVRGLDVVQVPTTLIAQTDSAVGGKTGVNLDAGKNLVGAWHPPRLVVLDPTVLRTLPRRHVVAGWAETIKHALVRDAGLLALLDAHVDALLRLDPILTGEVVARSVAVKCDVVAQDPREQGIRVVLNYGHTIGHGVEHASGYALHHGEAVSVGMVSAARLGAALGVTPPALVGLHRDLLFRFGLPVDAPGIDDARVRAAMQRDKKADDAAIRWVLLHEIAQPVVRRDVPDRVVAAVVAETCRA